MLFGRNEGVLERFQPLLLPLLLLESLPILLLPLNLALMLSALPVRTGFISMRRATVLILLLTRLSPLLLLRLLEILLLLLLLLLVLLVIGLLWLLLLVLGLLLALLLLVRQAFLLRNLVLSVVAHVRIFPT